MASSLLSYCLRLSVAPAALFLFLLSLPFLALPAFLFLLLLLLSSLSGLGFLLCLRYVLRLLNPRIEALMRQTALCRLTDEVKRANACRDGEDASLWDEGWLRWARAGVEGLRQVRVHEYLEDQIKNLGLLEGSTDSAFLWGWEERMSLDSESVYAHEIFSKGMQSSEDNVEADEDHRSSTKQRHVFSF